MANFTIKEGGQARAFTAKRLQTPLAGGGVEQWVPEDEHRLGTLYATKDGDYKAADEGYYAYSEVTASVPSSGHVTGKGPDGNTYDYTVDADGYLTETKVPSEIRITTPPTVTTYTDGDTINFAGLVVTAYDADGQSMGEVPFNELIFPVSEADYSSGNVQTVPVQWPRTGDGMLLETGFDVIVEYSTGD
jgi:hypothetical protein